MAFPTTRLRRLRHDPRIRQLVAETRLDVKDLVQPLFVRPGTGLQLPIKSMPGIFQFSPDTAAAEAVALRELGIPAVILFGIPAAKDETGSDAVNPGGIIQTAIAAVRKAAPDLLCIADLCLCEYTSHGHCGIIRDNTVDNDATLKVLQAAAVSYAEAGAGMIAPSGMMDGGVGAIRAALDGRGFAQLPIMAYAAKYASAFYGPFRDAAESPPQFGDRRSYQMDPANQREALREIELDIAEGADIVMVKPALAYLDIIARARERFTLPLAAYNVSGEYSMVKAAAQSGWINERQVRDEILTSIKRAGADIIISYHARAWAADQS